MVKLSYNRGLNFLGSLMQSHLKADKAKGR